MEREEVFGLLHTQHLRLKYTIECHNNILFETYVDDYFIFAHLSILVLQAVYRRLDTW